ncbi:MAG: bifunctional adenosylcobinamide kinase/adenosylcobinamide-phosphate guanylyltransferase [Selenomonadales bacterium]|nr:bifunctional adenosylcobinamide kinase/adenosylcobinamide-phosphate guanylyltransferase [Selenomonadales bacterium]
MGKIILVTGGSRSGKSTFAEKYAAKFGTKVAYVATAQVCDDEMQHRVDLHQNRRPSSWKTYECPLEAEKAIRDASKTHDMILFDCITIYITNVLLSDYREHEIAKHYEAVTSAAERLVESAKASDSTVIFVTNEVGSGIVPAGALSREYRDLAGLANQLIAKAADEVYLVTCGLATEIKQNAIIL